MAEYERIDEWGGCHPALRLLVSKQGPLEEDELEDIDAEMMKIGTDNNAKRVDVKSTQHEHDAIITYVYQDELLASSVEIAEKRIRAFTDFEEATIFLTAEIIKME